MSILPLNHSLMICEPFCDFLNLTSPKDNGDLILRAVQPYLDVLGASEIQEGLYGLPDKGGTLRYSVRGKVCIFSASGGLLASLRGHGLYAHYLAEFSNFEHRVSMLHATADFRLDAPPVIQQVYALAKGGGLSLTRKAIQPANVNVFLSPNRFGVDTGTVYLGNRANADVWGKVYDKGHERYCKSGVDIGSVLRIEIAVQSDVGATLRDASLPRNLFFHHAGRSLVTLPSDFHGWEPYGYGFALSTQKPDLTGIQRLKAVLDNSLDVRRLLRIARDEYGSEASSVLSSLISKRLELKASV